MTTPFNDAQLRWLFNVIQTNPAIDGVDGPQGPQGPQGADGETGPQGPLQADGAQGPQGVAGPVGPQGARGVDGNDGVEGVGGPAGPKGERGATGSRGPQGVDGDTGPQGTPGKNGSPGASGFGVQGAQGPQGADGGGSGNGFEPYGPDLVTGDSQGFVASLGDWVEFGDGVLDWVDIGIAFHPSNPASTHVLDFQPVTTNDYVELEVEGPFTAGVQYACIAVVSESNGDLETWGFGISNADNTDGDGPVIRFFPALFAYPHFVSAVWTPLTDHASAFVRLQYFGSGTPHVQMGWIRVAEYRDYPAFQGLDIVNRHSYMRFMDDHFQLVNQDFLVHALDVVQIISGEDFLLRNEDGPIRLIAETVTGDSGEDLTVDADGSLNLLGNQITFAAHVDPPIMVIQADSINMWDGTGLSSVTRPTIDPTGETGTTQLLVQALIALGVVIDGTP